MGVKYEGPYEACVTSSDEPLYGVKGPGNGFGYYGWYMTPSNYFDSYETAERVANMLNQAYQQGQAQRSRAIKALIE